MFKHTIGVLAMASMILLPGCNNSPAPCDCNCPQPVCPETSAPEQAPIPEQAEAPKPAAQEPPAAERDLAGQKEVLDFMKKTKTYYLATVENDQPRVRPFGTVEIFEDNLYIQTGRKKNVSHQIEENGKIELCTFDGERWLRLTATAIADDRIEAQTHMLDNYPDLKKMYQPGDGNTVVYKLTNVTATFESFGAEKRTIKF